MSQDDYTTASYGTMMCDRGRIDPYLAALRKVIVPGETTVLELGTGTGVVAFAAIQAGARKVYAVEPNAAIEIGREIAELNGVAGIEFIKAMSTNIDLPPADVLISDLRGVLPLHGLHIPSIIDARERLLRPGGAQIAQSDRLFVAPVEAEKVWRESVGYWDDNPVGLDMSPAKWVTSNATVHCEAQPEHLLAPPAELATIDYRTVESPNVQGHFRSQIRRDGVMHGLSAWFDTQLDRELSLSNAPGQPLLAYGRPMFPVLTPIELRVGEFLELEISARLLRDQYLWTWAGGVVGDPTRTFEQSSFHATDLSIREFDRVRLDALPARSESGEHVRFVLDRMDGSTSLTELATALHERWPDVGADGAVAVVSDVTVRFGRMT